MKKFVSIALALVLTLGMVGCGAKPEPVKPDEPKAESGTSTDAGTDASKAGSGKITIWAWDSAFNIKAANIAAEKYKAENPGVEVEVIEYAQNDIVAKLNTGLSSGNYKGLPNVVLIEDLRIFGYLESYPEAFYELGQKIAPDNFVDYKTVPMTVDGKTYGVPFDSGATATYYRTDLIEQAGYTKADMENLTWDKYIEIGKKVKEVTGVKMISQDPKDIGLIRVMLQSAGKWYVKEDGVTFDIKDNAVLKEALLTYKKMYDEDIVYPDSDWASYLSSINGGKTATTVTGCWITASVKQEPSQSGKWAIAATPRLNNADSINASNLGGSSWYVLKDVENSDVAADFVAKSFGTDTELLDKYVDGIQLISTVKSFSDTTEKYKGEDEYFGGQKIYEDFATWNSQIKGVNYGANTYNIQDLVTNAIPEILAGADIDATLAKLEETIKSQIVN